MNAQGYDNAQTKLGIVYATGEGVPQDYVQAHMLFNLAASAGHPTGLKNRDVIAKKMTPAQIAEARAPMVAQAGTVAGVEVVGGLICNVAEATLQT